MLLEGPHLVGAALDTGLVLDSVLLTPEFSESHPELVSRLASEAAWVEQRLLDELADADSPRGLVASATLPERDLSDLVDSISAPRATWVLLDGVQDPGNLGALARSVEAAGAGGLLFLGEGTVSWRHPRALRASAGSLLRLPCVRLTEIGALDRALRDSSSNGSSESQPTWVALEPRGGKSLWTCQLSAPLILCLGGEAAGLSPELKERCSVCLSIPTLAVESLNATVAVSVVLFELDRRSRSRSGHE